MNLLRPASAALLATAALALAGCAKRSARLQSPADTDASPASKATPAPQRSVSTAGWKEVAPGVEMRSFSWDDGGRGSPVVALRVAPARVRVVAGSSAGLEASAWRAQEKALAAFNGGFFDAEGRSLGARVSRGALASPLHGTRWSVFRIKSLGDGRGEARIVSADEFKAALGRGVRYESAVQCGPRLVSAGAVGSFKDQWARRTGLGIDASGRVIVAASDESLSLRGWAECFARGLACPDALNLDGGPSTQVSLRAGRSSLEWPSGRTVPDAIVVR